MRIQIDGVGTENKGAELMLYSILEQIELKFPDATVILNSYTTDLSYIRTRLKINLPFRLRIFNGHYRRKILERMKIQFHGFVDLWPNRNIDLVLDAGGFRYGDQWKYSNKYIKQLDKYYNTLSLRKTKIFLLPQAFGPFDNINSKKAINIINKYSNIIIAREEISRKHLLESGVSPSKLLCYPDFTNITIGEPTKILKETINAVCLIPNRKMYNSTKYSKDECVEFYSNIIVEIQKTGRSVFLLNHEGKFDLKLCKAINSKLINKVAIYSNLNAKEIKVIIGQSFFVISSRFHGVASALSQGVPCLATSWSHKYELLYNDYNLFDQIIKVDEAKEQISKKINLLNNDEFNVDARKIINLRKDILKNQTYEMWSTIWKSFES